LRDLLIIIMLYYVLNFLFYVELLNKVELNEKDSPTVDLTVWPLSGAITASPLLNSDGGEKVKTSGNLGDFTLFNCLSAH
jgi:hypothetical protein